MPARAAISQDQIDLAIARSLDSVFATMTRSSLRPAGRAPVPDPALLGDGPHIMGSVGFIGEMNGIVYLRFSETFAFAVTALVLGMSVAEVRMEGLDTVKDTVGELANMSVGGFKNAFSDLGYPCALTLPAIIRGDALAAPPIKGAARHVYCFEHPAGRLLVDLQLKPD